jgi:hypothetical protein
MSYNRSMTILQKALQQVGAGDGVEVLAAYLAIGRPPGEAAAALLLAEDKDGKRRYSCGFYEETKAGWDWVTTTRDEDKAYAGFLALVINETNEK